jgi:hypothetical protein
MYVFNPFLVLIGLFFIDSLKSESLTQRRKGAAPPFGRHPRAAEALAEAQGLPKAML